jgi:hypothetical protein
VVVPAGSVTAACPSEHARDDRRSGSRRNGAELASEAPRAIGILDTPQAAWPAIRASVLVLELRSALAQRFLVHGRLPPAGANIPEWIVFSGGASGRLPPTATRASVTDSVTDSATRARAPGCQVDSGRVPRSVDEAESTRRLKLPEE